MAPSDGAFSMVLDWLKRIEARIEEIEKDQGARLKDIEKSQHAQQIDSAERKGAAKMIRGLCAFLGIVSLPNAYQFVMWVLQYVQFR